MQTNNSFYKQHAICSKKIAILGSTGSIGINTLKVADHLKNELEVKALAAKSNIDLLQLQADKFNPEIIAVYDEDKASLLQKRIPHIEVVAGMEGLLQVASYPGVDFVVSAMSGSVGILPTAAAIESGKDVGLANKEVLVSAGEYIMAKVAEKKTRFLPLDSEHNAIFQCLQGQNTKEVRRLVLTASGGPFRSFSDEQLKKVSVEDALQHPTYRMGAKNTIDSSTLMNKGLEVIEAFHLFNVPIDRIEVVVHPQSIIHSFVEFHDGSLLAQLSEPNMLVPIQYALTFPDRLPGMVPSFDFYKNNCLEFYPPDFNRFSCLKLAYDALKSGGSSACFLNAANEEMVKRCLKREISWQDISEKLSVLMASYKPEKQDSLSKILEVDRHAREEALKI